jgi:hypothetical protein
VAERLRPAGLTNPMLTRRLHLRDRRIPKSQIHIRRIEHQDRLQRYVPNEHHIFMGQQRQREKVRWARFGLPDTRGGAPHLRELFLSQSR